MPQCPACESAALTGLHDRSGVAYDCCAKCRGVWLDGGELSQLMGKPFPEALLAPKDGDRGCPRCAKPIQRGGFLNPALIVDRCAYCSGLWLDASELRVVRKLLGVEKTTDAETAAPAAAQAPETSGPYLGQLPAAANSGPAPGGWQYHAGWWLILGIPTLLYGWRRYAEWKVLTDAGGLAGQSPAVIAMGGAVMTLVGLGFLILQPADPADFYLSLFKYALTPRRRYGRRPHSWYDNDRLV